MDEIIFRLQALGNPLSDDEYEKLSLLISALPTKNAHEFSQFVKHQKVKIESRTYHYGMRWLALTQACIAWDTLVTHTWFQFFQGRILGNDELMPITIALAPEDAHQLEMMQTKLAEAQNIDTGDLENFLIVNLHSAIMLKLEEQKNNAAAPNDEDLKIVIDELKSLVQIEGLKKICNIYLNYLGQRVYGKSYHRSLTSNESIENYVTDMNEINDRLTTSKNAKTNELYQRFILLLDMSFTLIREKSSSSHKIEEFQAKFLHHVKSLKPLSTFDLLLPTVPGVSQFFNLFTTPTINLESQLIENLAKVVYNMPITNHFRPQLN